MAMHGGENEDTWRRAFLGVAGAMGYTYLSSLVIEKVVIPFPGDIAYEDLGVKDVKS
ncbi:hypothetical protein QQ045_004133 [Rhodiola kirilowii]